MDDEKKASTEIYLPPDYNTIEYAPIELLERGDTDIWLRRRGDILKTKSKETALECEASKIVTLGAVAGAAIMSANPLAWIGLLIAGSGYVYTLFQERQDLGVVHPVPLYRGKLGNIFAFMEGEETERQPSFMDEIAYLSSAEKAEAVLIRGRLSELSRVLKIAPPKARFDLYRYTCDQFYLRQDLITGEEVGQYLTTAVSEARRSAILPQSQPVIEQGEVKAHAPKQIQEPTVSDRITASPAPTTTPTSTKWINNFISQTALIWGNQGSGKSWMARYVAKLKKDKGYRVVVLDPDSNRAEWEGVESYHDFDEIAEFLGWYVEELKGRYKAFNASSMTEDAWRAKLWADGKAIALICEEVTTYVDLIEDKELLTQFFRLGLTKSRKQEMPLTFVSHNNTQSALGGIRGLSNLIEKMLQLELKTDIDPETLQPVASGKGAVKLDGSNQWVPVTLPKLERKITNFGEPQPTVVQQPVTVVEPATEGTSDDIRDRLEALIKATPKEKTQPQSELAKKLLEIIQSATKHPISFESIRKSRKWENGSPDKATLLAALSELSSEWIRGSETEGYYLQD